MSSVSIPECRRQAVGINGINDKKSRMGASSHIAALRALTAAAGPPVRCWTESFALFRCPACGDITLRLHGNTDFGVWFECTSCPIYGEAEDLVGFPRRRS